MSLREEELEEQKVYKQGVRKLFNILLDRVIEKETTIEYKNADYKKFLKFIDVAYESVAMVYVKNVMSKIDEATFNNIVDRFVTLCKDMSYIKFSLWISNNKDVLSLYNINEPKIEDKFLQIAFYERTKQIMFYIYESLNFDSYGLIKENYDNSIKIYELMKNEIRYKRDTHNEYKGYSIQELELALKLEKDKEKRLENDGKEAVSRVKIMEGIYIILSELIDHRNDIAKTKFDKYLEERNIYGIKLFKAKQISMSESYISRVRKDILSKNTEFNEDDDPTHIELVSRCLKKLKEKPWEDIDTIIIETRNEMQKENYCHEKKILREFSYKEYEITNIDGSKRIYFEKIMKSKRDTNC